jgi:hypothetical protein
MVSCNKENPVVTPPPEQPDTTNRFNWSRTQLINLPVLGLYVADSNNIYINAFGNCVFYDGNSFKIFNFQDPSYLHSKVYGYDKNNIFFVGDNTLFPILKKLTNTVIKSYIIDSLFSSGVDIKVMGPDQAWISVADIGKVYYFDHGTITSYRLDVSDSVSYGHFYKNKFGELFVFAVKGLGSGLLYSYKFTNNEFELLRIDCYSNVSSGCLTSNFFNCGDDILLFANKNGKDELYYFNGGEWVSFCETVTGLYPYRLGGWSKDSLISLYVSKYDQNYSIYTWNGINWRKENIYFFTRPNQGLYPVSLEVNNGNIYITYDNELPLESFLIIGKPNNQKILSDFKR